MPNSFSEIKYEMPSEQLHEELSDENSQELAHEMKVRVRKFLSGVRLKRVSGHLSELVARGLG